MKPAEKAAARASALSARWLLEQRPRFVRMFAGPVPRAARGLEPQALLLGRLSSLPRPGMKPGVEGLPDLRERTDIEAEVFGVYAPRDVEVQPREVEGAAGPLAARFYVPRGVKDDGSLLVYFHGGGWSVGSLDSHDSVCRMLAYFGAVRVVAVDYRLAPENPFPAAYEDAVASFAWIAGHADEFDADPSLLAVGGDSAGGNLSAAVANAALRGECPVPAFQLLIYPVTELSMKPQSYSLFGRGYYLTRENMEAYIDAYVPRESDRRDPRAAPLHESDLTGAAPAFVATALADPLRDEGVAYASRLKSAGVDVRHEQFPLLHGFVNMSASPPAHAATVRVAEALRDGLDAAAAIRPQAAAD